MLNYKLENKHKDLEKRRTLTLALRACAKFCSHAVTSSLAEVFQYRNNGRHSSAVTP